MTAAAPLLHVENLSVSFGTESGRVAVVEDVSFEVPAGKTVGLVGESGCGKSVSAMTVMRLLPSPPSRIDRGQILFDGKDLARLSEDEMRAVRGDRIGMIFQEPMTSLNPTLTVGFQIAEVLRLHRRMDARMARIWSVNMLKQVGIGGAERRLGQYPHELSGGLRQRVMIAMALVCRPALLIADEPTTALDVTIQAQILDLLRRLQQEMGMAILLITHDLGVVAEMCEEVFVMYAGRIVERAAAMDLFRTPRHPYTAGLLAASPRRAQRGARLQRYPEWCRRRESAVRAAALPTGVRVSSIAAAWSGLPSPETGTPWRAGIRCRDRRSQTSNARVPARTIRFLHCRAGESRYP